MIRGIALFLAFAAFAIAGTIDDLSLRLPEPGDASLHALAPDVLEVTAISLEKPGAKPVALRDTIQSADFTVAINGEAAPAEVLGFKRRALYAPLRRPALRIATSVYLKLATPLDVEKPATISVRHASGKLWRSEQGLTTRFDPLRYGPALHVNQEGYQVGAPKSAFVGYSLGDAGELPIPAKLPFRLVDARSGRTVFEGTLLARRDVGFTTSPRPYQNVWEADFSAFDEPGEYRLAVPGFGASAPLRIGPGEWMNAARAFALGLYHQRCGTTNALPYTRFTHDVCHSAPAAVPVSPAEFSKAWDIIAKLEKDLAKPKFPEQQLKRPEDQLYPFVRKEKVDVAGGHHDAGDYSKYTINSAALIHALVFAVDSFPGVAELDNLGLPESGDGVSDVLQEAKWEADFIAKLQDEDGGFYFLVYPRDRRYETTVTPDRGDPQIVWPKTTAATAAAVAALAQCAGSPEFKRRFPDEAKRYLEQAKRGFAFLERAIERHGRERAYQRLTHYGDAFADDDELAWAACELFVATGDRAYEKRLLEWYPNPSDPSTRHYQWRNASFSYGNALRSYAFAVSSGRLKRNEVDSAYVKKCEAELRRAGDAAVRASELSAYGVSFPEASKRINRAGWFFPSDEAFDLTVAHQLMASPKYQRAVLANLNYELGANPINRVFITGLGFRRQREIVHQYAQNDARVLPPSGIPLGAIHSDYMYLDPYKTSLRDQSWPRDEGSAPVYPLYDRWADTYNVNAEFVVTNQARALASLAFWAAQTPLKTQPWKGAAGRIVAPTGKLPLGQPADFRLEAPDLDLSAARVVWEGRDQEPALGPTFSFTPRSPGKQWVEAEAALPDGRRIFARAEFIADAPVVVWVDGALPAGATPLAQGGDTWDWIKPATKPKDGLGVRPDTLQHESALAEGIHEHGFYDAEKTLEIARGDVLFAYVFIDPKHPPKTLMLEWNDGSQEHRAFWGENHIPYGKHGTAGQRPMGRLPPTGRWVRLEVPAAAVDLEGRVVHGMVFRAHGGRIRWDASGKFSK